MSFPRLTPLVPLTLFAFLVVACGDRSKMLGNPCKDNADCDVGMLRGICMGSVLSKSYCSMPCAKDEECGAKPGFVCGAAEVTSKGTFSSNKQEAKYCKKAKSDLQESIERTLQKPASTPSAPSPSAP